MNHGVYVHQQGTSVSTPLVAQSGVPFVVGTAPMQMAENPGTVGVPVLCTSWDEAVEKLGYSDNWKAYTLCEFMYSHFKLFERQPVIFCNVLDADKAKEAVPAADMDTEDHKVILPAGAIKGDTLVVKPAGGAGSAYVDGTDYSAYYDGDRLVVEMMADGAAYEADQVNVAYSKVAPDKVTVADIAAGFEAVELCLTKLGIVPDLLCAPGYSHEASIAAVMAAKAGGVNGMFKAKALIDIDTGASGARTYADVLSKKTAGNIVDVDQIACWPMVRLGDHAFHLSTQLAGVMAQVDTDNGGVPYESPSNKGLQMDGLCVEDGTEVTLTLAQANTLNANGVVTAINFTGGWTAWGNYTACYPGNTDVKDYFIPVSRMFGWVGNTVIRTFWRFLGKPMTRLLIDNVVDTCNIWLNGLVGAKYLLGARIEFRADENPETDLMAGIIRMHIFMTPPSPAQEIDFTLEYDVSYITSALQA